MPNNKEREQGGDEHRDRDCDTVGGGQCRKTSKPTIASSTATITAQLTRGT
jgi:ligand-binding sensor protein